MQTSMHTINYFYTFFLKTPFSIFQFKKEPSTEREKRRVVELFRVGRKEVRMGAWCEGTKTINEACTRNKDNIHAHSCSRPPHVIYIGHCPKLHCYMSHNYF